MKKLLSALLLLLPLSAVAQPTLFATQACGDCETPATGLYTINPLTGAPTLVGNTGESITGLDFHPSTGVLYGTTTPNSLNPSSLITIDPATGVATLVGAHGVDRAITDLTFAPDGTLYGWAEPGQDSVVTIDIATGAATLVADSQVGSGGCAFDMAPDGFLYLFGAYCDHGDFPGSSDLNSILKINSTTGQVVDYRPIVSDANWDCDSGETGAFSAASHDAAGNLFGISNAGCSSDVAQRNLTRVDLATGVPTLVGVSLDFASGLAFAPGTVGIQAVGDTTPVPSLQRSGLLLSVILLALFGGLMLYRRKHA